MDPFGFFKQPEGEWFALAEEEAIMLRFSEEPELSSLSLKPIVTEAEVPSISLEAWRFQLPEKDSKTKWFFVSAAQLPTSFKK